MTGRLVKTLCLWFLRIVAVTGLSGKGRVFELAVTMLIGLAGSLLKQGLANKIKSWSRAFASGISTVMLVVVS